MGQCILLTPSPGLLPLLEHWRERRAPTRGVSFSRCVMQARPQRTSLSVLQLPWTPSLCPPDQLGTWPLSSPLFPHPRHCPRHLGHLGWLPTKVDPYRCTRLWLGQMGSVHMHPNPPCSPTPILQPQWYHLYPSGQNRHLKPLGLQHRWTAPRSGGDLREWSPEPPPLLFLFPPLSSLPNPPTHMPGGLCLGSRSPQQPRPARAEWSKELCV